VYVYSFIISYFSVDCEGFSDLPSVMTFSNLNSTDTFKAMIATLKGVAGVYGIIHISTGRTYLGSSSNIGLRLMSHLVYGSCNLHLQNALALYGLSAFVVTHVSEYIWDPALSDEENAANLLKLEQYWLDKLFSLPSHLRFNFASVAGATMSGQSHTEETKAKISTTKKGHFVSEGTKALMSTRMQGENNPNYGKVAANAAAVLVYNTDGTLVQSFSSQSAAAKFFGIDRSNISRYIKSGRTFRENFVLKTR